MQHVIPTVFADSATLHSEVWGQSVSFRKGVHYIIEAASGLGKSSLCSFLYGERRDYEGRIHYDGVDIGTYGIDRWVEVRRGHIAYLPQNMGIFPELTVRENIMLKNRLTGYKTMRQIEDLAEVMGIAPKLDTPARLLSVGQQQRMALVRTVCQPCDFFLLDEPVSHLDEANNRIAADMLVAEAQACGAGIIATSVGNRLLIPQYQSISL